MAFLSVAVMSMAFLRVAFVSMAFLLSAAAVPMSTQATDDMEEIQDAEDIQAVEELRPRTRSASEAGGGGG